MNPHGGGSGAGEAVPQVGSERMNWAAMLPLANLVQPFSGDGSGATVREFLEVFQKVADMGGWTNQQRIGIAKLKLCGAAQHFAWFDSRIDSVTDFAEFKRILIERFDPSSRSTRLQALMDAVQEANEGVQAFGTRIQVLGRAAQQVHFEGTPEQRKWRKQAAEEMVEEQMLHAFTRGLRDRVKRFVLSRDPKSFIEALSIAIQEEEYDLLAGGRPRVHLVTETQDVKDLRDRLERLEMTLRNQGAGTTPRFNGREEAWNNELEYGRAGNYRGRRRGLNGGDERDCHERRDRWSSLEREEMDVGRGRHTQYYGREFGRSGGNGRRWVRGQGEEDCDWNDQRNGFGYGWNSGRNAYRDGPDGRNSRWESRRQQDWPSRRGAAREDEWDPRICHRCRRQGHIARNCPVEGRGRGTPHREGETLEPGEEKRREGASTRLGTSEQLRAEDINNMDGNGGPTDGQGPKNH